MNDRQLAGAVLIIVGAALIVTGGVAAMAGGGSTPTPAPSAVARATASQLSTSAPSASGSSASTIAPSVSSSAGPSPSPVSTDALVRAFVADLIDAYHGGSLASLAGRLHPAVIDRYGAAACQTSLAAIPADSSFAMTVKSISAPAAWDWTTDGRTTSIPATLTVAVDLTRNGTPTSSDIHVVVLDGAVRWFSDCGTPLS